MVTPRRAAERFCFVLRPTVVLLAIAAAACHGGVRPSPRQSLRPITSNDRAFLDSLEEKTFHYFWDLGRRDNGLVPDRAPTPSFSSIAAVGFALSGYAIGAERGYVMRDEARDRALATLRFFARAPSSDAPAGVAGDHGFYYHFLDMETGFRYRTVELSTIDTALLLAGALTCAEYFDRDDPAEREIRALAEELYSRADWAWAQPRPPAVSMGWTPEKGFLDYDWHGYNEGMIVYILALGSPTHAIDPAGWQEYTRTYFWSRFEGEEYLAFGSLFGYQYSHAWIDFRGLRDPYLRSKGIDYFENSRRATYAQRNYAIENPMGWKGYGADFWGLSACDGPADVELEVGGHRRRFFTYAARGASAREIRDDGTLTAAAAAGSLPFAPEIALPALEAMAQRFGANLFSRYGFLDAFNPSFPEGVALHHGRMEPGLGWFDTDYLGIDEGVILAMVENWRSGLLWRLMRRNPHVVRGLRRAGFAGGWLDAAPS
jgi:hypothetical protein